MTINMVPDDVLVEILSFYLNTFNPRSWRNAWHALVRVCRRWRCLVFASPRSLNLRLNYSGHGPISEMPDAWPVLPVILISSLVGHPMSDQRWDNMVSALESEHCNRIRAIYISDITNLRWERFAAAMRKPFPELTSLEVSVDFWDRNWVPVLPDSFLGRSAPRLRELELRSIPFPEIPKLLLSANGLVTLSLLHIPNFGYFSPDAMAAALTAMTGLESLRLEFRSPRSRRNPESLPPPTRFVLPTLTKLTFKGIYEDLEALLARIDAPLLYYLYIVFFMDPNFDVPQLHRLISHAEEFQAFDLAQVLICNHSIQLNLYPKTGEVDQHGLLKLHIICGELDRQISSLAQICSSSFPLLSALEELQVLEDDEVTSSHWKVDMENAQWLELLEPFTALKDLYLTDEIARRVCGALQEISGERANEVLPTLRNLFVNGCESFKHIEEAIRPLVTARQLPGHPVIGIEGHESCVFFFQSHLL